MQIPVGAEDEEVGQGGEGTRRSIHGGAPGRGVPGESGGERKGSHRMGGPAGSSGPHRRRRIPEPCRLELGDGGGGERDEDAGLAASR